MVDPLLNPTEVLQLSGEYLIAFIKGTPPILARRIKYFADPAFRQAGSLKTPLPFLWWLVLATVLALLTWGTITPKP
jgi:type IV secretory pathway TraG/TraD family ATPase VirD4